MSPCFLLFSFNYCFFITASVDFNGFGDGFCFCCYVSDACAFVEDNALCYSFNCICGNDKLCSSAVCKTNKEANTCDWFTCFCIGLYDLKAWLFFVENNYLRFLACEKLYVVFRATD